MSKESSDPETKLAPGRRGSEPKPKVAEFVLVDYQGEGGWSTMCGSKYLVLTPGLNLVEPELWAAYKAIDERVKLVTQAPGEFEPDAIADLVGRTMSKAALSHLQRHLPGPLVRRVPGLVKLIERKLRTAR